MLKFDQKQQIPLIFYFCNHLPEGVCPAGWKPLLLAVCFFLHINDFILTILGVRLVNKKRPKISLGSLG